MLKRALTHLKFELLTGALGIPKWQAIGLLEGLWLFAQFHAIDGNLSPYSTEQIAAWLQYKGDHEKLFTALVESGWLDLDSQGNLSIHDWQDHCPNWLKGAMKTTLGKESENPVHQRYAERTLRPPSANALKGKGKGKGTKKKKKVFEPPTLAEVQAYARQRSSPVDPKWFHDYYSANDWHDSRGTPVENWKLKLIAREPEWQNKSRSNGSTAIIQETEIDKFTDAPPKRRS